MEQPNTQRMLAEGVAAAKSGNRELARKHFFDIIATDPQCFDVWLWLGGIADDPSESVAYLSHALEMRPDSIKAQKGMAWAQQKLTEIEGNTSGEAGLLETAAAAAAVGPSTPRSPEPNLGLQRTSETGAPKSDLLGEPSASNDYRPAVAGQTESASGLPPESEPAAQTEASPASDQVTPASATEQAIDLDSWSNLLQGPGLQSQDLTAEQASSSGEPTSSNPFGSDTAESGSDLDWDAILSRLKSYDSGETEVDNAAPDPAMANLDGLFAQLSESSAPPSSIADPEPFTASLPTITFDDTPVGEPQATPLTPITFDVGGTPQGSPEPQPASGAADSNLFSKPSADPQTQPESTGFDAWFATPAVPEDPVAMENVSTWLDEAAKPLDTVRAEAVNSWLDNLTSQQTAPLSEVMAKVTALIGEGKQAIEAGNLAAAIPKFQEALQINPNSIEAREQLGIALYQTGRDVEAAREFETITRMKPDHAEAYANLGFILTEQGKGDEAIDCFTEALKHDGSLIEARLGLAELYQKLGRLADAVGEWQQVNTLRPDLNEVHKSLGDAYLTLGRIEEGILEYRIILERDPRNAYAHLKLGEVFIRMDRLPEAATQFEKSITIDGSVAEAHYGLGVCLAEQGQRAKAIEHLERALALRHDYPEASASLDNVLRQPEGTAAGTPSSQAEGGSDEGKKRRGIFKWGRK